MNVWLSNAAFNKPTRCISGIRFGNWYYAAWCDKWSFGMSLLKGINIVSLGPLWLARWRTP